MVMKMDKRERSEIFAARLDQAMERRQATKSGLARLAGADRSTIGLLLKQDLPRLPNAQLVADIAAALGVSADWLLGLTDRPERPGEIISAAMSLTAAERSSADSQIRDWHVSALGTKIRHVPATLPDMLKTRATLEWEYAHLGPEHLAQAAAANEGLLDWLTNGSSDYEIAIPIHEVIALAEGSAYYAGLGVPHRKAQLAHIAARAQELYPRLRIYLFDAHKVYSAPVTVFGAQLGVLYVGRFYLAFREKARITAMSGHFDWLVREAVVDARNAAQFIAEL